MAITGKDAAYKTPNLIPDEALLPRDNSGGLEDDDYTQKFGDGGFTLGGGATGTGGKSGDGGSGRLGTDRKDGAKDAQRDATKSR